MKTRRMLAALMILCLAAAVFPASAAPARDARAQEVTLERGLQTLANIMANAVPGEIHSETGSLTLLESGQAPGADFAEQALWAAVMLSRPTTFVSGEEAKRLLGQLFTEGEGMALPDMGAFVSPAEGGWEADPHVSALCSGAYIYSARFDGTDVFADCDLYWYDASYLGGGGDDAEEIPEEALTWVRNAQLTLRFAPETEFGYTVSAIVLSPVYEAGQTAGWPEVENAEYEYSFSLPSNLALIREDPAHRQWRSADGAAALSVEVTEETLTYDMALARFMQAHPGRKVEQNRLSGMFYSFGEGVFSLVAVSEELPWVYAVEMTFPKERQAEYELYAEFIRNSLSVWGISNG